MKFLTFALLGLLFSLQFAYSQAFYFTPYPLYWGANGILATKEAGPDWDLGAAIALTNTFRYNLEQVFDDNLIVDYDATIFNLRFHSPSYYWGQVSLEGIAAISYQGYLDAFLEAFHMAFHLPNQGRELFEQNLNRLYYNKDGTDYIFLDQENFFRPEIQVYYHSPWFSMDPWGIQALAGIRLGMGGPLPFDDALAVGVGAGVSWEWQNFYSSLTLGGWYRTPPDEPWGVFYLPFSFQGELQIEYKIVPWIRAFSQFVFTTAPYDIDNYWLSGGLGFFTLGGRFLNRG
jgi:hypothetical protein